MANPGLFFVYFPSFLTNIITIFTTDISGKNVHPVYGAGIRTHDLRNVSLFPLPLDQGSRPNQKLFILLNLYLGMDKLALKPFYI